MKLERLEMGGVANYYCPFVPLTYLIELVKFYKSGPYVKHFEASRNGIMRYSSHGRTNSTWRPHGEYLMSNNGFNKAEESMLGLIKNALAKNVENFCPNHVSCGVIRTVEKMMHQLSHLDHADVLSGTKKAFIGHMGLEQEGSVIRLDIVSKEALQAMANNRFPNGQKQKIVLESLFVWIPFGSILLLDARQFHGGHYGTNNVFRFHCVISDFNFATREQNSRKEDYVDHLYLLSKNVAKTYKWHPSTAIGDLENWFEECKEVVIPSRKPYIEEFKKRY